MILFNDLRRDVMPNSRTRLTPLTVLTLCSTWFVLVAGSTVQSEGNAEEQAVALEAAKEAMQVFIGQHGQDALNLCVSAIAVKMACSVGLQLEAMLSRLPHAGMANVNVSRKVDEAYSAITNGYRSFFPSLNLGEEVDCKNQLEITDDCADNIEPKIAGNPEMLGKASAGLRTRDTGKIIQNEEVVVSCEKADNGDDECSTASPSP